MKAELLLVGASLVTGSGNLTISSVVLIHHPSGPILVDCAAWNQRRALLAQLEQRSLRPSDIAKVVFTHLHWDHCMNFDLFPEATLVVPEREWHRVGGADIDTATPVYIRSLLAQRGGIELLGPGEFLQGITALATPGHTAGHMAIAMKGEQRVVMAGDALPARDVAISGMPHLVFGDAVDARRSVAIVLAGGDVVVPGHDAPFMSEHRSLVLG